jgi:hypothetical protein
MPDFKWKPISTAPSDVPKDKPVLLFARHANVTFDAAADLKVIWMAVVGYRSKAANGWRDVLLSEGDIGRREIDLEPTHWTQIPEPFPYPK